MLTANDQLRAHTGLKGIHDEQWLYSKNSRTSSDCELISVFWTRKVRQWRSLTLKINRIFFCRIYRDGCGTLIWFFFFASSSKNNTRASWKIAPFNAGNIEAPMDYLQTYWQSDDKINIYHVRVLIRNLSYKLVSVETCKVRNMDANVYN